MMLKLKKTNVNIDFILCNSDKEANRPFIGHYVNVSWVLDVLSKIRNCKYCYEELDETNFSIDRLNNSKCHSIDNCQIIHVNCNKSKK